MSGSLSPQAEQERRRSQLEQLRPDGGVSSRPNYEAHHPPLAYLSLALLDWPISGLPLTDRVLFLRLFAAALSTMLLYFGMLALCGTFDMPERFTDAALFTLFCSQMLYATVAHVANDWLAIGLSALFFASLAEFVRKPVRRSAFLAAAYLAAGLLTKAYFLAIAVPAFAAGAMLVWQRRVPVRTVLAAAGLVILAAGPWYIRNVNLYKNLSGTHEEFDGIGIRQALAAAPQINWSATAGFLARSSLWTGNNSFTSFSRSTLHVALAFLFLAFVAWLFHRRAIRPAEWIVFGAVLTFTAAIAYATCASFADKKGDVAGASPWYTQVLLVPVLALTYLGLARSKWIGRVLAACMTAIWTWLIFATWVVKLFPMYSGGGAAPMRLADIWQWYLHGASAHAPNLSLVALAPAPVLYAGLFVSSTLSVLLAVLIVRALFVNTEIFKSV